MLTTQEVTRFADYPFSEALQADLRAAGYETPTPIQAQALGLVLEGGDIIGLAQTGTGKTAAFALPIIHRLQQRTELGALVLAPTRELVQQIVGVFRELGRSVGTRVASIVGGMPMEDDWKALSSWPNVLVATPGRLIDHLEQKTVSLKEIEIFVIDEADRMHDMGFIPQIRRIIAHLPKVRQTLMFTATMPADVERIVRQNMRDAIKIQAGPASMPVERAEQQLFAIAEDQKTALLVDLLRQEDGRVLVFLKTKRGVDRLAHRIQGRCAKVARLHGDREQAQRDEAMGGFREGRYRVLLATDIAARGLDVADIEHVINYDFPRAAEDYIHRIGRTARLEASGKASSFVTPADRKYLRAVEQLIGAKINLIPWAGGPEPGDGDHEARTDRGSHGRGRTRGGRRESSAAHAPAARHHDPVAAAAGAPVPAGPAGPAGEPAGRHRRRRGRGGRGGAGAGQAGPQVQHSGAPAGAPHGAVPAAPAHAVTPRAEAPAAGPQGQTPAAPGQGKRRRRRRGRGGRGGAGAGQAGPQVQDLGALGGSPYGTVPGEPAGVPYDMDPVAPEDEATPHAEAPDAGPQGQTPAAPGQGRRRRRRRGGRGGASAGQAGPQVQHSGAPAGAPVEHDKQAEQAPLSEENERGEQARYAEQAEQATHFEQDDRGEQGGRDDMDIPRGRPTVIEWD